MHAYARVKEEVWNDRHHKLDTYNGKSKVYATCPQCSSRVRIKNLDVEDEEDGNS